MYIEYASCSSDCLVTADLLVDIPGRGALTYPVDVNHGSSYSLGLDLAPGTTLELLLPESSPSTDNRTCHFKRLHFLKRQTVHDLYSNRVVIYNPQDLSTIRRLGTPMPSGSAVYDVAFLGVRSAPLPAKAPHMLT